MMLVDGELTEGVFEKLRLILSTYQDGTGHEHAADGTTIPGYRQFERALALAAEGHAPENKKIFDVLVPVSSSPQTPQYGISCKMRGELDSVLKKGYVYIEVSNARSQFIRHLERIGIKDPTDYRSRPTDTGLRILDWISELHHQEQRERHVLLEQSSYLILLYNAGGEFRLYQYPANLFLSNAADYEWSVPSYTNKEEQTQYRQHLRAEKDGVMYMQWFWTAGHLKFFPNVADAVWTSETFRLEPLPNAELSILHKVEAYFPDKWKQACELSDTS